MAEALGSSASAAIKSGPIAKAFETVNSPEGVLDANLDLKSNGTARSLAGGGASALGQAGAAPIGGAVPTPGFSTPFQMFGGQTAGATRGRNEVDALLSGLSNDVAGFGGPK